MKLRSSLSQKVLVLVTLPLIVQWGCLYWLYTLQVASEHALERSLHAKDIAEGITNLRVDMYKVVSLASGEKGNMPEDQTMARAHLADLQVDYTYLLALTKHDSTELRDSIVQSREEMVAAFNTLIEIKKTMALYPDEPYRCKPLWVTVRKHMAYILRNDFAKVRAEQDSLARLSPAIRADLRRRQLDVMLGLALAGLIMTALSAIFLTRGITLRVAKVSDNAYRLAAGRVLNPALTGTDEIASLDRAFHDMARALREASLKEQAVVENARDSICSLSGSLKFTAANPACERLLAVESKELIGQSLLSFIAQNELEKVKAFFDGLKKQSLKAGADAESIVETQLRSSDNLIYAELSAHWSNDENSFFVVAHDTTDRRQAEALKQEVVVMVTHDLRTPLATLQNILKFLRTGNFGKLDPKGTEYISIANRNVERMSNLVNDLLDIEKVKSGLMTLDKQELELQDCFTAARELAGAFAEEAEVKIEVVPSDLCVIADQDRVTRVLGNLIANAVKFSPKGGFIRVEATRDGAWVYTAVSDQGPGIPADQISQIFERFRQVENSDTKGKGGSGLGLTICQAIVELHGGKIWVENLPKQGSRFIFTLPVA